MSVERPGQVGWAPILLYHRVVPVLPQHDLSGNCISTATFESHLKWLVRRGYSSMPLADVGTVFDPDDTAQRARRGVVVTFDDGYRDNYLHAWPLLKRYGFTATIFLVSDAIGGESSFDAAHTSDRVPMLSANEVREMYRQGIDFGSHTCSHPDTLVALSDGQLADELERSRSTIESLLDASVPHFSYPHSKLDDRVEVAVERAGYRLACAGVGTRFAPFCLHRVDPAARRGSGVEMQFRWRHLKWLIRRKTHRYQIAP